jgi:hypothetical protein
MTIILLKLFIMSFVTMIFCIIIRLPDAGKHGEYFCYFIMVCAMVLFTATICSFIWWNSVLFKNL